MEQERQMSYIVLDPPEPQLPSRKHEERESRLAAEHPVRLALTVPQIPGGLCAYVGGPSYVRSSQDLSCDFCNDVLARAKYFKRHGF